MVMEIAENDYLDDFFFSFSFFFLGYCYCHHETMIICNDGLMHILIVLPFWHSVTSQLLQYHKHAS